jgi:hypothetical protein
MRLVYLSPVPWASFAQRPHKFVEWFHGRHRGNVLWVDPYPTRLPQIGDFRLKRSAVVSGVPLSGPMPRWLKVVRPRAFPVEPLPGSGVLNQFMWRDVLKQVDQFLMESDDLIGIGKPSALALQVLVRHTELQSFYDAMDDFPAFYKGFSRFAMERREHAVAAKVSNILVSSTALARRFDSYKSKVLMALNACATEILPKDKLISPNSVHPVLGYVGTIGNWFDWQLVIALANTNPMVRTRLIGPVYSPPPNGLPPNIELLPACDHATALLAMQEFSVGLIPFKPTDLTASVDPIKYYEYRALGLPVISTSFGEMVLRKKQSGVFLVSDQSNLSNVVERALAYESDRNEIYQFRKENSWGARFDACGLFA